MAFGNATKGFVRAHSGGGGGGGTSNYNDLSNKPKINGVELTGNKTSDDLGISGGGVTWNSALITNNKITLPKNFNMAIIYFRSSDGGYMPNVLTISKNAVSDGVAQGAAINFSFYNFSGNISRGLLSCSENGDNFILSCNTTVFISCDYI